jgi:hypothetical protein
MTRDKRRTRIYSPWSAQEGERNKQHQEGCGLGFKASPGPRWNEIIASYRMPIYLDTRAVMKEVARLNQMMEISFAGGNLSRLIYKHGA